MTRSRRRRGATCSTSSRPAAACCGARSAAAPAASGLPRRPGPRPRGGELIQARAAAARRSRRSCRRGTSALIFSQWTALLDRTEPVLQRAGIDFARLGRQTRDRRGGRRTLPGDGRSAGDADLAQGRRHRPQPDRRRPRLPARPVVEPGGRGPSGRPRAPHRSGPPRSSCIASSPRTRSRSGSCCCRRPSARSPRPRCRARGAAGSLTRDDLLQLLS